MSCPGCVIKDGVILAQRLEIAALRAEVNRLKRIIDAAEALCATVATEASTVLSTNQPKGVWAYNKGKKEAVDRIGQALYY